MTKRLETGNAETKPIVQLIKPAPIDEMEVARLTYPDGRVEYHHPVNLNTGITSGPLKVNSDNLIEFIQLQMLGKISALIDNMGDEVYNDFGYVFASLSCFFEQQLDQIGSALSSEGITLIVDCASSGNISYRNGRILGVRWEASDPGEEAA